MRPLFAVLTALATCTPAMADHHLEKRALMEARCIPAEFREAARVGAQVAYEVVCNDAAARRITLVCGPTRCAVDAHSEHSEVDEP
jgi:hypothetical protein